MVKVTWDDKVCIHSGKCVATLPKVFRIEDGKFVIDESAGTDEEIQAAVAQCPSGALKIGSD
jgi:uncharacterized Fe-S cluster protein YjdI